MLYPPFTNPIIEGTSGFIVQFLQEMLVFNHFDLTVDGVFGNNTAAMVKSFQNLKGRAQTGEVDADLYTLLVSPLVRAFASIDSHGRKLGAMQVAYAQQNLFEKPIEINRDTMPDNAGPWVRAYLEGLAPEGSAWCAAFATTMGALAAKSLDVPPLINRTASCYEMMESATVKNCLSKKNDASNVRPGDYFLLHDVKKAIPWKHTGLVVSIDGDIYQTIEGNSAEDLKRSFKVCSAVRKVSHEETFFIHAS